MSVVVASVLVLLIASALAIILKRVVAETVFISIAAIVFLLYCFGFINMQSCLMWGLCVIIFMAIASLVLLIVKRKALQQIELWQGVLLYSALLLLALIFNYGRTYSIWDEYSNWGPLVRHLFYYDALSTFKSGFIWTAPYLPGMTILEYFFTRFSKDFAEWPAYVSICMLYFSLILPFLKDIFRKAEMLKSFILLVVLVAFPFFVAIPETSSQYLSLYVDGMLGFLFGFPIIYYFFYPPAKSVYGTIMLCSAVFMLTLTKDTGIVFAIGVILIAFMDSLLFSKTKLKSVLLSAIPATIACFAHFSWNSLLSANNLGKAYDTPPILQSYYLLLTRQLEEFQLITAWNWRDAVFNRPIPPLNLSISNICLVFIFVSLCTVIWKRSSSQVVKRNVLYSFEIVIGAVLYQVLLLYVYTFLSGEWTGNRLQSYERYTMSYVIGMILVLFIPLLEGKYESFGATLKKAYNFTISILTKYGKTLTIIIACAFVFFYFYIFTNNLSFIAPRLLQARNTVHPATKILKWQPYFNDGITPYIIVQKDQGLIRHIFLNEMYENLKTSPIQGKVYSVALEPYYPEQDDPWTFIATPQEWKDFVVSSGYSQIYVYYADDKFRETYGAFFTDGVQDDMLYDIAIDDGSLIISPVSIEVV